MRNLPDFVGGTLALLLLLGLVVWVASRTVLTAPEIVVWETNDEESDTE